MKIALVTTDNGPSVCLKLYYFRFEKIKMSNVFSLEIVDEYYLSQHITKLQKIQNEIHLFKNFYSH